MVDPEKPEFLNISLYAHELKAHIGELYAHAGKTISAEAQADLDKITPLLIAKSFTMDELERWQKGNELLELRSFLQYEVAAKLISQTFQEKNIEGTLEKHIHYIQSNLSKEQLRLTEDCLGYWHSLQMAFISQLKNSESLNIILSNIESQTAKEIGKIRTHDDNDTSAFLVKSINTIATFIRGKLETNRVNTAPISNLKVGHKLKTPLTSDQWRGILLQLVKFQYLPKDYLNDPQKLIDWVSFVFDLGENDTAFNQVLTKLKWLASPSSLGQFIVKFIDADLILYKDNDRTQLYEWVIGAIEFEGADNSIKVELRSSKWPVEYFQVGKLEKGVLNFAVRLVAPKPRKRKAS